MPMVNGMGRHTAPLDVPEAMTFHPTMEEFKDFNKYVAYMEEMGAARAGICKIVPPKEWIPRKIGYNIEDLNYTIEGPIKQHFNQVGIKGTYQTKGIMRTPMSVQDYYKLATSHTFCTPTHTSYEDLERKYWKSLNFVPPIYGCDVAANLTDPEMDVWNIAKLGSILDLVKEESDISIQGVLSPYLYFGMWKATFSWHIEDMDLYAINMVHHGAPKTWYCVPPKYGHLLEKACRKIFPNVASWCSNFMRHKTCMIAPHILDQMGVPYQKVVQEERNIIITFPYAYHCGFNHGFNIAESTNFATEKWIEYGKRSRPCDCSRSRVSFTMDGFVKKFQPEKYQDWIDKKDIAPHPEDPPEVVKEILLRAENPEAYRKMMEERMRKLETRKPRITKVKEEEEELENMVSFQVDLYQHHELANVKVEVNPTTMKCRGGGLTILKNFLNEQQPDVQDLIDRGILIKVGSRQVEKLKRPRLDDDEDDGDLTPVHIYRHIQDHYEAIVDPNSLELVGNQPKELISFLKETNLTIKNLIEMNIFTLIFEANVRLKKEPKEQDPPAKRIKLEEQDEASMPMGMMVGPTVKKVLHKYKHEVHGIVVKVDPDTLKPFYRMTTRLRYFLRGRTVQEIIEKDILKFNGEIEVDAKTLVPASQESQEGNVDESMSTTLEKSAKKRLFPCDIYRSKDGTLIKVSKKTMKIVGRKSDNLKTLLEGKEVKDLIDSGDLILVGEQKVGQKSLPDENGDKTIKEEPEEMEQESEEIEADQTNGKTDATQVEIKIELPSGTLQFLLEEDPDEIEKMSAKPEKDSLIEYSDEEDDEMLYTTESSSDSNESSDDPNFGSGRQSDLWSHRSSKSKRRKMKKLKKMKLISKQERYERLMNRGAHRSSRSEKKQQRRAKAVDTMTFADLTRKIIIYLNEKFKGQEGDGIPKEFDFSDLKEKFSEDRSNVMSILKIFEGLEIVKKNTEDVDKYYWYGVDREKMYDIFTEILDGGKVVQDSMWLLFRDFVRELLFARKGGRVYPELIGKIRFGVNETRRVTISAAILEGMKYVQRMKDDLGGVVWAGRDIFQEWIEDQRKMYSEAGLNLKRVQVNMVELQSLTPELINEGLASAKSFLENTPGFVSEDLSAEQQRSVANQNVVCRCGFTKKTNIIVHGSEKSHIKKTVLTGHKKRTRCTKCAGCTATKCGECQFCLKPHFKKPCIKRNCMFPIVPKCPCFA